MIAPPPPTARTVALDLIGAILDRGRTLDEAFELRALTLMDLRDRGFVRQLVSTLLRRLGQIDAAIAACLERPLSAKAAPIRNLLRLGAVQLLFLHTPPHAAVDNTVGLVGPRLQPYRALVNAVLRRLSKDGEAILAKQDAARLNLADWLWQSWTKAYGEDRVRAMMAVIMAEPPLDLTVKADAASWAERLGGVGLPTGAVRVAHPGAVADLPGFAEGAWWVQDAAAALPAQLLGPVNGQTVIDLCAAPGGKAAQLAAAGARVVAVDRSEPRLARLRENFARLRLEVETIAADAASWRPATPARFILLDAPCTATGTLRRHPDIGWRKTPDDVARMTQVQDRLLNAAADMLAPGGTLVFCTCSLQPEEGHTRVEALIARHALRRRPIAPSELHGLETAITTAGDLRTLPCHLADRGGMDGFFASRLVREG